MLMLHAPPALMPPPNPPSKSLIFPQHFPAGDPLASFGGADMKAFLQRVEAAVAQRKFRRPPIGPIGAQLALLDDKWAVAVEVGQGDGFLWWAAGMEGRGGVGAGGFSAHGMHSW